MQLKRSQLAQTAVIAVSALVTSLSLGILVHAQEGGRPPGPGAAPRQFKNIKVLKGLPPGQVLANMRVYSSSLGVRCTYCHVEAGRGQGFERDDKPTKLTARKMILMMSNLNKREKVLKGKVSCYTCHRGKHEPEAMPATPMMDAPPGGPRPSEPGGQRGEGGDKD